MSKKTIIFVGPTLPKAEVLSILPDALVLPPAEQGDVDYAFRQLGAETILLIDGVHTSRLPVWHKEILAALANGAALLGAASMGALRAVECEPWGAEPIGEIASWYREGVIDGDDEVCLAHGDQSTGYRHLSVPMVNIRATIACTKFSVARKREILDFAKALFYPDRVWQTIFVACELTQNEIAEVLSCEVNQKAADAMQACYAAASLPVVHGGRKAKHLNSGYGLVFRLNDSKVPLESGKAIRLHEIVDRCPQAHAQAMHRVLALEYCKMVGLSPREECVTVDGLPYEDLADDERLRLCNQERVLARGREWLISSGQGFHEVPAVLDFLHSVGMYDEMKGG